MIAVVVNSSSDDPGPLPSDEAKSTESASKFEYKISDDTCDEKITSQFEKLADYKGEPKDFEMSPLDENLPGILDSKMCRHPIYPAGIIVKVFEDSKLAKAHFEDIGKSLSEDGDSEKMESSGWDSQIYQYELVSGERSEVVLGRTGSLVVSASVTRESNKEDDDIRGDLEFITEMVETVCRK